VSRRSGSSARFFRTFRKEAWRNSREPILAPLPSYVRVVRRFLRTKKREEKPYSVFRALVRRSDRD